MLTNQENETKLQTSRDESTIIGVFDTRSAAENAIQALHAAGFNNDQLGFVMRDISEANVPGDSKTGQGAVTGLLGGTLAGGILGTVGALLVPGFGLSIAAGILTTIIGGTTGSLLGALTGMGLSEEEAKHYEERFKMGHALVSVHAGERRDEAIAVLRQQGASGMMTPENAATQ